MAEQRRLLVGVTGASGSVYAEKLIEHALEHFSRVYVCFTSAGAKVAQYEMAKSNRDASPLLSALANGKCPDQYREKLRLLDEDDLFAPVASGTSAPTDMVVVPCSMGTLARITHGMSSNLLERAADVVIKERKRMILVPRETPFSVIHLKNMLQLAELGVQILPPSPGFYNHPQSLDDIVDFVVGKIFDALSIDHTLTERWNHRRI